MGFHTLTARTVEAGEGELRVHVSAISPVKHRHGGVWCVGSSDHRGSGDRVLYFPSAKWQGMSLPVIARVMFYLEANSHTGGLLLLIPAVGVASGASTGGEALRLPTSCPPACSRDPAPESGPIPQRYSGSHSPARSGAALRSSRWLCEQQLTFRSCVCRLAESRPCATCL